MVKSFVTHVILTSRDVDLRSLVAMGNLSAFNSAIFHGHIKIDYPELPYAVTLKGE